jgi:putative hydrolase of the HAD superfamily
MHDFPVMEAVLFDAFGTLIALDDPVARLQAALAVRGEGRSPEQVDRAFREEVGYYREHQDTGRDGESLAELRLRCAAVLRDALRSALSVEDIRGVLGDSLRYRVFPDVLPTVDLLTGRGLRLGVVSNWDAGLPEILADVGVADRFTVVAASAVVGARKPDPRIFRQALDALDCQPGRAIHVGNSWDEDVVGAHAAGLAAVLIDRTGSRGAGHTIRSLVELPELLAG